MINKKYQFGHLKTGFHNTRNGVTCDNQIMYYYVMLCVFVLKLLRHACLCQNMHSDIRVTDYNQGEKYQNTLLCRVYVDYNTCVYNLRYHYVVTLQAELIQIKQPIVEIVANNTNYVMFISNSNMYYLMVSNLAAPMKSETAKSNALDFGDHTEKVNYYVYKKCNQTIYRIPRHLMIIVTLVI